MIISYSLFDNNQFVDNKIDINYDKIASNSLKLINSNIKFSNVSFDRFLKKTDKYNSMISYLMKNYYANKYKGNIHLGLHNKPIILDDNKKDSVYINITHTDGICLGIETLSNHIGIDVERKNNSMGSIKSCFLENEPITIKQWTKKEAYVKMTGIGISDLENFKIIDNKVWEKDDELDHNIISFSVKLNGFDYIISICGNWNNDETIIFEEFTLDSNKKILFEIIHKDNPNYTNYTNLIDEYESEFYSIKLDNSDYKIRCIL